MASLNEINAWLPLLFAAVVVAPIGAGIGWAMWKELYCEEG